MITADRDLDCLVRAIIANPGDHAARLALADLACDHGRPEAAVQAICRPGEWLTDWDCSANRYILHWRLDSVDESGRTGVILHSLRRKHAPRCGRCLCYQPIAGPRTGWQWRCRECLQDIGRRKLYLDNLAHVRAIAASNPSFRPVADRMTANDRYLTCPICAGAGLVGASLCSLCGATGELARVSSP